MRMRSASTEPCSDMTASAEDSGITDNLTGVWGMDDSMWAVADSGAILRKTVACDTTPDAFSFDEQTGVTPGSMVTSNSVTISGLNAPAAISVSGGTYSIGCNGTFIADAKTISNGQSVCVRHTTSSDSATTTVLTIGGVSGTFRSAPPGGGGGGGGGNVGLAALLALLAAAALRRRAAAKGVTVKGA